MAVPIHEYIWFKKYESKKLTTLSNFTLCWTNTNRHTHTIDSHTRGLYTKERRHSNNCTVCTTDVSNGFANKNRESIFWWIFYIFFFCRNCVCKRRQVVVPAATVVGMTIYRHSTFQIYTLLALVVICLAISDCGGTYASEWFCIVVVVYSRRGGSGRRCRS